MSSIRDSLQYKPSPYSVEEHFQEAHAILKACQHAYPDLLAYLLEPSNVLVLGGMRAVSPYATFGKHLSAVRSEEFRVFLSSFGIAIIEEEFHYATTPREPAFILVHTGALPAVKERYAGITDWWAAKPVRYDFLNYGDWYNYNVGTCQSKITSGTLPKRWLADWYAPHNICFGMLLGYPGAAICSYVNAEAVAASLNVKPDVVELGFAYPENMGVSVSYAVAEIDRASKQITAHHKHWQEYLDAIYRTWTTFDYR